jgi:hypothetical protein
MAAMQSAHKLTINYSINISTILYSLFQGQVSGGLVTVTEGDYRLYIYNYKHVITQRA